MSAIVRLPAEKLRRLQREYDKTHWCTDCAPAAASRVRVPNPAIELVELGVLISVTYATTKDDEFALWEHEFRRGQRPWLSYNRTGLVIAGGSYKVTERGIEG